jgi:hypothetical protein
MMGRHCKCSRCGRVLAVPASSRRAPNTNAADTLGADLPTTPDRPVGPHLPPLPTEATGGKKTVAYLLLGAGAAAGLVALVVLLATYLLTADVDRKLGDLKGTDSAARQQALVWLAEADVDAPHRPAVTAALEPLVFEGDVRNELNPDVALRAYLHWAGPDNAPALIRLVQNPAHLPARNVGAVMQTLGKLHQTEAAGVIADRLGDRGLGDQAADALRVMGKDAENAVISSAFDPNPAARRRAGQLLTEYNTEQVKVAAVALSHLNSNDPNVRQGAAVWLAENAPTEPGQQASVAKALTNQLDDLSDKVNGQALRALKLWATRDNLPQLIAFARRTEKTRTCTPELIDVLARFPEESAADAIALQLKSPANRAHAVQGLLKLGPVANAAVLHFVDDHDPAVQKAARSVSRQLSSTTTAQVDQLLADVGSSSKSVACAALTKLSRLRPDADNRTKVSQALNAPLLDSDPVIAADALSAVRVWGTKANTVTLLKLLARPRTATTRDPRVIEALGTLRDPAAAPALAEGLNRPTELDATVKALVNLGSGAEDAVIPYLQSNDRGPRFAAVWILGEVGTTKSLDPIESARRKFAIDGDFDYRAQVASDRIVARK